MTAVNILFLIFGILFVLFIVMLAFSGPSLDKALARRLMAIKDRHGTSSSNIIERQMRRIKSNRALPAELAKKSFFLNPRTISDKIDRAGKTWTFKRFLMGSGVFAAVVMAGFAYLGLRLQFAAIIGCLAGVFGPNVYLGTLISGRIAKFTSNFPDAIDLMVRGLRSGLPIAETLGIVSSEIPDPVGAEFRMVSDKMRIGRTMDAALIETADRIGTPEFQFFTITLNIQRETGGNLAETLANLSDVLRKRAQMKLKIKALSSEARASAYIVGALPFLVFAMIWMEDRPYLEGFFYKPSLMIAGGVAIAMLATGAGVMAKMINFEI
jgi:tight adherence protein B